MRPPSMQFPFAGGLSLGGLSAYGPRESALRWPRDGEILYDTLTLIRLSLGCSRQHAP